MVNHDWADPSQRKLEQRSVVILTWKSVVQSGNGSETLTEPSSTLFTLAKGTKVYVYCDFNLYFYNAWIH